MDDDKRKRADDKRTEMDDQRVHILRATLERAQSECARLHLENREMRIRTLLQQRLIRLLELKIQERG